jgi:hypothetical protein
MKKYVFYLVLGLAGLPMINICEANDAKIISPNIIQLAEGNGVWEGTKNVASDTWKGTKEVTSDVWDGAKKVTSDVWDGTKNVASDVKDGVTGDDADDNMHDAHHDRNHHINNTEHED